MIKTVGDLLDNLVQVEREKLAEFSIVNHPGIIGDMYEGLAREVTQRALSPASDLRVVKGKIVNSKGELSRQIDCMIVHGEGKQIPYTDHWICDVKDVIAVVEVKKSLYGADLADGVDLMADLYRRIYEPKPMLGTLLRDAWTSIHGSAPPDDPSQLPLGEEYLFHSLMVEANLPVRILFGFDGFVSESSLRKALVGLIDERLEAAGSGGVPLGPLALPSLVLCRSASLIKLNGMPYGGPFWPNEDGTWGFIGSRGIKPLHVLLELLWTRLTYYYGASPSIFGEDLDVEAINLLLKGRPVRTGNGVGWALDVVNATDAELVATAAASETQWQPAVLSKAAFIVVNSLCRGETVDIRDPALVRFLTSERMTSDGLLSELRAARLAAATGDGKLELLTEKCACVIDPELGFVAAEDKSGRLRRWVLKRMAARGTRER